MSLPAGSTGSPAAGPGARRPVSDSRPEAVPADRSGPTLDGRRARLDVSRGVVLATARLAVREVPGVVRIGRGGSLLRRLVGDRAALRLEPGPGGLEVRLVVVARPGQPLARLGRAVAAAVRGAIERILGLEVARVVVVVDGVGG